MLRKLWLPAPNYKRGDEMHCGNCARSITFMKGKTQNKNVICVAEVIDGGNGSVYVVSTCTGEKKKYSKEIINL